METTNQIFPNSTGDWVLNTARREVFLKGRLLRVTSVQFDFMAFFIGHAGQVVTRNDIFQALHMREYDGLNRMIDINVSRLRRLFRDNPKCPRYLKTVRGVGYLFCSDSGSPIQPQ
jgi:two-component system response regulator RstA